MMEWKIQETYKINFYTKKGNTQRVWLAINRIEKEIGEIKAKHRSILQKHLDEIKQLQSPMIQTLYALNEIMESNAVSATINYSCEDEDLANYHLKWMYRCQTSFQKKK